MFNKEEMEKSFPSLHGKGKEIREDTVKVFKDPKILEMWKKKYPSYMHDMVYNNFLAPLMANDITPEEQKKIVSRLDLFCASIS